MPISLGRRRVLAHVVDPVEETISGNTPGVASIITTIRRAEEERTVKYRVKRVVRVYRGMGICFFVC